MGGIPWWAALIGTPIVAGKMASGVAETVDSLNKVNESLDHRADRKQYASDLAAFGKDKSYLPQSSVYRDPETALKVIQSFQKEAAPSLVDQFKTNYENATGTSDPRFFGDADGRAELAKVGVQPPANNPFVNASLADFQKEGAQRQTLKAAQEGDTLALASIAADKDLAPSYKQASEAFGIPIARQIASDKEARIQQKEDFAEKEKLDTAAQQAEFDRIAAYIGGRHQDALPERYNEVNGELQRVVPTIGDPNAAPGYNYVQEKVDKDGKVYGIPSQRQIMPYEEARKLLMQATSDYPKANAKEALAGLRNQYKESYSDADFKPSAVNWMGEATNDKNQLQLAANSGDRIARGILSELDRRELAQAKGKREIIVANPPPRAVSGKLTVNDIPDSDAALLNNAIASGQLNADKVNSRTAHLYVKMLKANPSLDFNNSAATSGALKKLETQRSVIQTFEQTASKNFDLVEKLYNQNPQGTIYLLNQLKTNFNTKITGDPQTVAMGRALKTALNEYAKVVTGQTGGAAVSDSARKEVETLLSQADKPEAFRQSLANHRQEMRNRMEAFDETLTSLRGGRGGNVRAAKLPDGARSVTGPNGQKGYLLGGVVYAMDGRRIK